MSSSHAVEQRYLTLPQAAQYLGRTEYWLKQELRAKRIPHHKDPNKGQTSRVMFDRRALDAWMESIAVHPEV